MSFSRKQQQILGVFCLLYGLWIIWFVYSDRQKTVELSSLAEPESPAIPFYIDPPVDVNSADAEELQLLPNIGPILAQRIIEYRERHGAFNTLESLKNIYGIGPKTVQKLAYYLELTIEN